MRAPIGSKIRNRRKGLGVTQALLAKRAGISASYLNLIEANKREVGGALLNRIAAALEIGVDALSGEEEGRQINALRELLADPVFAGFGLGPGAARDLVASGSEAVALLIALYRRYLDSVANAEAYANRLGTDPLLSELLHQMLSQITAIRSLSEIVSDDEDMPAADRGHFDRLIAGQAATLSDTAVTLAGQFDRQAAQRVVNAPGRDVHDFIIVHDNHFPSLEEAAARLLPASGAPLPVPAGAPGEASDRFRALRDLAAGELADEIDAILDGPGGVGPEARPLARRALASYAAGAALMPYEAFHAAALATRFDTERLAMQFSASYEQVAHRLVTLRRPGAAGIPFGFLRADPSGLLSKQFPIPGLLMPNVGHACPLWAIYDAFRRPDTIVRQVVRFNSGARFLFVAKAVRKGTPVYGQPDRYASVLLCCDLLHADRTVYADGLDLAAPETDIPVGPACRLCPREACTFRQEPAFGFGALA